MKHLLIASILIAVSAAQAGTLKLPGSNLTRNAGTSIPVTIQASGFPAGSKATVSLVKSGTWVSTPWLFDVPIINGNNPIEIPIDWSFLDVGSYLVKVNVGNNQCTSTWIAKIRSAVIWPYGGSVFYRGTPATVTWIVPDGVDYFEVYILQEGTANAHVLDSEVDPDSGRLSFIIPIEALPASNYRIHLDGFAETFWWDEDLLSWEYGPEMTSSTQSEKITIR